LSEGWSVATVYINRGTRIKIQWNQKWIQKASKNFRTKEI
jgi:hypothetical protein